MRTLKVAEARTKDSQLAISHGTLQKEQSNKCTYNHKTVFTCKTIGWRQVSKEIEYRNGTEFQKKKHQ